MTPEQTNCGSVPAPAWGQRALDASPGGYEHSNEAVVFFFCLQLSLSDRFSKI